MQVDHDCTVAVGAKMSLYKYLVHVVRTAALTSPTYPTLHLGYPLPWVRAAREKAEIQKKIQKGSNLQDFLSQRFPAIQSVDLIDVALKEIHLL